MYRRPGYIDDLRFARRKLVHRFAAVDFASALGERDHDRLHAERLKHPCGIFITFALTDAVKAGFIEKADIGIAESLRVAVALIVHIVVHNDLYAVRPQDRRKLFPPFSFAGDAAEIANGRVQILCALEHLKLFRCKIDSVDVQRRYKDRMLLAAQEDHRLGIRQRIVKAGSNR